MRLTSMFATYDQATLTTEVPREIRPCVWAVTGHGISQQGALANAVRSLNPTVPKTCVDKFERLSRDLFLEADPELQVGHMNGTTLWTTARLYATYM